MFKRKYMALIALMLFCVALLAQVNDIFGAAEADSTLKRAPVVYKDKVIFYVYSNLGHFTSFERSVIIGKRLEELGRQPFLVQDSLNILQGQREYSIRYGESPILIVSEADSLALQQPLKEIAIAYHAAIVNEFLPLFTRLSIRQSIFEILKIAFWIALILGLSVLFWRVIKRLLDWLSRQIDKIKENYSAGLVIRGIRFLNAEQFDRTLKFILALVRFGLGLLLFYFTVYFLLFAIPQTKSTALHLHAYIMHPIVDVGKAVLKYLPNLFFILVVVIIARYLLRFLKYLFDEIRKGHIRFAGFYADWAYSTYHIVRFLILFFVVVIIFPYLPGSGSPAFQGISIFVGVLVSLGSSSAISNIIAGIILTYMRAFKVGDYIKVGDKEGFVIDASLLNVRIKTVKNVEISIPNSVALSGNIMDYSTYAREGNLIVHTPVAMGYEVPWKQVKELLIQAALNSEGILKHKPPFVHVKELKDYYIVYELNAYTDKAAALGGIYSELNANVLDVFNAAGIEMLLPMYNAVRDGKQSSIPPKTMPEASESSEREHE
ncbi:MAG: mechanosensitive ion channel [Candidatus Cloacimonetes bacterium]|nr:mechanosensitive ion channel [Candidatus Cloacimonadota bacterium]